MTGSDFGKYLIAAVLLESLLMNLETPAKSTKYFWGNYIFKFAQAMCIMYPLAVYNFE